MKFSPFIVGVVTTLAVALGMLTVAPAQATSGQATTTTASSVASNVSAQRHVLRQLTPSDRMSVIKFAKSAQFWSGTCKNMVGLCIFMNRDAQKVLASGAIAALGVALCGVLPVIGCALAAALLAVAYELIAQRGGICGGPSPTGPYYHPNLEIRYTWSHVAKCVS